MEPDLTNELDLHENNYDVWGDFDFCMSTHVYMCVYINALVRPGGGGGLNFLKLIHACNKG